MVEQVDERTAVPLNELNTNCELSLNACSQSPAPDSSRESDNSVTDSTPSYAIAQSLAESQVAVL